MSVPSTTDAMACFLCKKRRVPSHVLIRCPEGKIVGWVCGTHTLAEVVLFKGRLFKGHRKRVEVGLSFFQDR